MLGKTCVCHESFQAFTEIYKAQAALMPCRHELHSKLMLTKAYKNGLSVCTLSMCLLSSTSPCLPTDKTNDILNLGSRQYHHNEQQHTKLYNERDNCNILPCVLLVPAFSTSKAATSIPYRTALQTSLPAWQHAMST